MLSAIKDIISFIKDPITFIIINVSAIIVVFIIAKKTVRRIKKVKRLNFSKLHEIINHIFQYTKYSLEVNMNNKVTPRQKKHVRRVIIIFSLFYLFMCSIFPIMLLVLLLIFEYYILSPIIFLISQTIFAFLFRLHIIVPVLIKDYFRPEVVMLTGTISVTEYNNNKIVTKKYQDFIYDKTGYIFTRLIFKVENLSLTFNVGKYHLQNYKLLQQLDNQTCLIIMPASFFLLASTNLEIVKPFGLLVLNKKNNKLNAFYPKYINEKFLKKKKINPYTIRKNKKVRKKTYQLERELYKYKKINI